MKLQEALLKCTRQFGREVLKERRLIFMLLDYHAFRDYPAMKKVMKALLSGGDVNELFSRSRSASRSDYLSYAESVKKKLAGDMHFRREFADYAVDSVSLALGMLSSVSEPFDPYEKDGAAGRDADDTRHSAGTGWKQAPLPSGFRMKWLAIPLAAAAAVTVIVLLVLNNAAFQYHRGEKLYEEQNYGAAVKQLEKAADKGDTNALVKLGLMYETGRGVPKDNSKAIEFYDRARKLGNEEAESRYGQLKSAMDLPSSTGCTPLPDNASDTDRLTWIGMCE